MRDLPPEKVEARVRNGLVALIALAAIAAIGAVVATTLIRAGGSAL